MENYWQSTFQELGTKLFDATFVVVDLETSGGTPQEAGITEIGAVKIRGGAEIGRFTTLLNPGHPIPRFITDLTGIDDSMVAHAPVFKDIADEFREFLGDKENIFVAQNAPFDLSFLHRSFRAHSMKWPKYRVLDTAVLARKVLSREEAPNCKLGTLAQVFNVSVAPTHRALDDALATVDVLHGIFERLAGFGVYTVEETLNFGKKSPWIKRPNFPRVEQRDQNQ